MPELRKTVSDCLTLSACLDQYTATAYTSTVRSDPEGLDNGAAHIMIPLRYQVRGGGGILQNNSRSCPADPSRINARPAAAAVT